jgi:hypothetical protein
LCGNNVVILESRFLTTWPMRPRVLDVHYWPLADTPIATSNARFRRGVKQMPIAFTRCGNRYGRLHATIASGRVRLATDGGSKIAR